MGRINRAVEHACLFVIALLAWLPGWEIF